MEKFDPVVMQPLLERFGSAPAFTVDKPTMGEAVTAYFSDDTSHVEVLEVPWQSKSTVAVIWHANLWWAVWVQSPPIGSHWKDLPFYEKHRFLGKALNKPLVPAQSDMTSFLESLIAKVPDKWGKDLGSPSRPEYVVAVALAWKAAQAALTEEEQETLKMFLALSSPTAMKHVTYSSRAVFGWPRRAKLTRMIEKAYKLHDPKGWEKRKAARYPRENYPMLPKNFLIEHDEKEWVTEVQKWVDELPVTS